MKLVEILADGKTLLVHLLSTNYRLEDHGYLDLTKWIPI